MILFIDNYDSFIYNLVQYFGELDESIEVFRNDEISLNEIETKKPDCLVISPGPCTPHEAGISLDLINKFAGKIPILGVCLGHQAIAQAFGGEIIRTNKPMHGKASYIYHDNKTIYKGIPNPFNAGRYHSLIVNKNRLPSSIEITAWTENGEIMGLRHKEYVIEGVQFHPESILTASGKEILINYLSQIKAKCI